jgi:hypothetical protein
VYESLVYFAGPKSLWSQKVDPSEVIMRREVPWRWLARALAVTTHARLDPTRCGWVVLMDGKEVEHVESVLPKPPTTAELLAKRR